jgi:hypothetical protein
MTLHELLEQSAIAVGARYEYEDLDLSNATIFDKLNAGQFPVCLVLPFDIVDEDRENGVVKSTAEINALFLTRYTVQETTDKPSSEIEQTMVAPMRALARSFVNLIDHDDLMFEEGVISARYRSVHQSMFDSVLYGCWVVFSPKFTEDLTTCS